MTTRRFGSALRGAVAAQTLALVAAAALSGGRAGAAPPVRAEPPPTRLPPLPPAILDDTLEIGGKEIAAKRVSTRMSVAVRVDRRGPFAFVVDSGADTTAVSTRLAAT